MLELIVLAIPPVFIAAFVVFILVVSRAQARARREGRDHAPKQGASRLALELRSGLTVGLFVGFILAFAGMFIKPLPDLDMGRKIATPVVCPNGGVPYVQHYRSGKRGTSYRVVCLKEGEPDAAPGEVPGARFPTLTTSALSFSVYWLVLALVVATVKTSAGLVGRR